MPPRTLLPKTALTGDNESAAGSSKFVGLPRSSAGKRTCVSIACVNCRKRKSKCDGQLPCAACTKHNLSCDYNTENDVGRGNKELKRRLEKVTERDKDLSFILSSIRSSEDKDVEKIVKRLRAMDDYRSIAQSIRDNRIFDESPSPEPYTERQRIERIVLGGYDSPSADSFVAREDQNEMDICTPADYEQYQSSLHSAFSDTPPIDDGDSLRSSEREFSIDTTSISGTALTDATSPTSALPQTLDIRSEMFVFKPIRTHDLLNSSRTSAAGSPPAVTPPPRPGSPADDPYYYAKQWTANVTTDGELIAELLYLYFEWNHVHFPVFQKSVFLDDLIHGTGVYSSPLLLNALLSVGCQFSDNPKARANPADPTTKGEHFFAEARRIMESGDEHIEGRLTTAQAFNIMCIREGGCGRDQRGWAYLSFAARKIYVHKIGYSDTGDLLYREIERITYWGSYNIDREFSHCLGRLPQLQARGMPFPPKPTIDPSEGTVPMGSPTQKLGPSSGEGRASESTFIYHAALSEIVDELLQLFHAPSLRVTTRKVMKLHAKLSSWHNKLPRSMRECNKNSSPAVLVLHMYYQSVILYLFRPFLDINPGEVGLNTPRMMCGAAADKILSLYELYHSVYTFQGIPVAACTFCVLATVIRLCDPISPSRNADIVRGVGYMQAIAKVWPFLNIGIPLFGEVAKKVGTELPIEVEEMLRESEKDKVADWRFSSAFGSAIMDNLSPMISLDFDESWAAAWVSFDDIDGEEKVEGKKGNV